jgi:hypothetical protein
MSDGGPPPRSPSRKPIVYRGTTLGVGVLAQLRRLLRATPRPTRNEIARRVCRLFDWRRPNGEFAVRSCSQWLSRLDRRGILRLPPSRAGARPGRGTPQSDDEMACVDKLVRPQGPGLLVRPVLEEERAVGCALMQRHHYLGYRRPPGCSLLYVAFLDGEAVALLGWATATLHNGARDRWVGWDVATKGRRLHLVVANVRFLLFPWVRKLHLASRLLAANLRRLSGDWQAKYGHPVLLAETFVDPSRFRGTCYRASNWIALGQTRGWSRRGDVFWRHGQRKQVFAYPLHRRAREWLAGAHSPVDTFELQRRAKMTFDVSRLSLEGRDRLLDVLATVHDPRHRRGLRHRVVSILALAVGAILAGARSFEAIAQWAEDLLPELREKLGGRRWRAPSESTFRRVLKQLDAADLDRKVSDWIAGFKDLAGNGIALDGKTLRGSHDGDRAPVHLVSAVLHAQGLVLGQVRVPDKGGEIGSVKPLVEPRKIEGAVVTGDAQFTQREIARYVVKDKKADYLFTVKANQPGLLAGIENLGLEAFPPGGEQEGSGPRSQGETSAVGERDRSALPRLPLCPAGLPDREDLQRTRREREDLRDPLRDHEP